MSGAAQYALRLTTRGLATDANRVLLARLQVKREPKKERKIKEKKEEEKKRGGEKKKKKGRKKLPVGKSNSSFARDRY